MKWCVMSRILTSLAGRGVDGGHDLGGLGDVDGSSEVLELDLLVDGSGVEVDGAWSDVAEGRGVAIIGCCSGQRSVRGLAFLGAGTGSEGMNKSFKRSGGRGRGWM